MADSVSLLSLAASCKSRQRARVTATGHDLASPEQDELNDPINSVVWVPLDPPWGLTAAATLRMIDEWQ